LVIKTESRKSRDTGPLSLKKDLNLKLANRLSRRQ
jgi:hypothetical protein